MAGDTGTLATQCITSSHHDGKTDLCTNMNGLCKRFRAPTLRYGNVDAVQVLRKSLAILGEDNRRDGGAQNCYMVFFQNPLVKQFNAAIQCCLPPKGEQNTIRAFFLNNFLDEKGRYR